MSTEEYCVVMTTTETKDDARALARQLVEAHLVACAQILSIDSVFVWDGQVNDSPEWLILLKTRTDVWDALVAYLEEHHPYDVPEILRLPIAAGFGPYLSWVSENTTTSAS